MDIDLAAVSRAAKRHRPSPTVSTFHLGPVLRILVQNDFLSGPSVGAVARTCAALATHVRDDDELWAHLCRSRWPSTAAMPPSVRDAVVGAGTGRSSYRAMYAQRARLMRRRRRSHSPPSGGGGDNGGGSSSASSDDGGVGRWDELPPAELTLDDIAIFVDVEDDDGELASAILTGDALIPLLQSGTVPFDLKRPITFGDIRLTDDGVWEMTALKGVNVVAHLLHIREGTWLRLHESRGTDSEIIQPWIESYFRSRNGQLRGSLEERDIDWDSDSIFPVMDLYMEPDLKLPVPIELEDLIDDREVGYHSFHFTVETYLRLPFSARHFGLRHILAKFKAAHGSNDVGQGGHQHDTLQAFVDDYWRGGRDKEDLSPFFAQAEKAASSWNLRKLELGFSCELQGGSCVFASGEESKKRKHGVTILHILEILLNQVAKDKFVRTNQLDLAEPASRTSLEAVLCILAMNGFVGPPDLGQLACKSTSMKASVLDDEIWTHLCVQRWPSMTKTPQGLIERKGHRWLYKKRASITCSPMKGLAENLAPPKLILNDLALFIDIEQDDGKEITSEVLTGDALVPFMEKGTFSISLKYPIQAVLTDEGYTAVPGFSGLKGTVHLLLVSKDKWLRLYDLSCCRAPHIHQPDISCGLMRIQDDPYDTQASLSLRRGQLPPNFENDDRTRDDFAPRLFWRRSSDTSVPVSDSLQRLVTNRMPSYRYLCFDLTLSHDKSMLPLSPRFFSIRHFLQKFQESSNPGTSLYRYLDAFDEFLDRQWADGRANDELRPFFEEAEAALADSPQSHIAELGFTLSMTDMDSDITDVLEHVEFSDLGTKKNGVTLLHIFAAMFE